MLVFSDLHVARLYYTF